MLPAKLLRYRRSSDNRKKRKTKEKAENAKRRRSRNARATEAEKAPVNPEKTDEEGLESRVNTTQNEDEIKLLQATAERYHRHALHFFGKWKEAETGTLRVIEERDLTMMEREIGRGCFGTCYLAKFGARTVVVKQQQNCQASRQEARMTARLSHPNTACFIGIVERQNRVDIVSTFYNINGERFNLGDIRSENATINWSHLLGGLCRGIRHIHDKIKILHNDIKSNNVVLDGPSLAEAEAVLVDFGKATDQSNPRIYQTPADTKKFEHLAPELGQPNGRQSKKTDIYSVGFLVRGMKYKFMTRFPTTYVSLYRSCLRSNPLQRPTANELCEAFDCANS